MSLHHPSTRRLTSFFRHNLPFLDIAQFPVEAPSVPRFLSLSSAIVIPAMVKTGGDTHLGISSNFLQSIGFSTRMSCFT